MTRPLTLWLRRGSGLFTLAALLAFILTFLWQRTGWSLDAGWGSRYIGVATPVTAPAVAAVTAYDYARRWQLGFDDIGRVGQRRLAALLPAAAMLVSVLVAVAVATAAVVLVVARNEGMAGIDAWYWPEMIAVYAAATAVGVATGQLVSGLSAPVLAGIIVMVGMLVTPRSGLSLFTVAPLDGTSMGLEVVPGAAACRVAAHLGVVLLAWALVLNRRVGSPRRVLVCIAAGVPLVLALAGQVLTASPTGLYRSDRDTSFCIGSAPTVCGPQRGQQILTRMQQAMADGVADLSGSGLPVPTKFTYGRLGTGWSAMTTQLDLNVESLAEPDQLRFEVAGNLARPRACAALYTGVDPEGVLPAIDRVQQWIVSRLEHPSGAPAPASIRADYEQISTCPMAPRS